MQSLLMGIAFSSERVDSLLEEDSKRALDAIQLKLYQLEQLRIQLKVINIHLAQKKSGESVYLRFDRIVGAAVVSGIVAGSSSIYFPPGLRVMIAANISARGLKSGMITLNEVEANKIRTDLVIFNFKIQTGEASLKREASYYCKQVSFHEICY
jgi:hypothetical protein